MIEGGQGMLNATSNIVNHYLVFRSPNFKNGYSPKVELKLRELYSSKVGEDRYTWFKKV